jgi:hypothetical protein
MACIVPYVHIVLCQEDGEEVIICVQQQGIPDDVWQFLRWASVLDMNAIFDTTTAHKPSDSIRQWFHTNLMAYINTGAENDAATVAKYTKYTPDTQFVNPLGIIRCFWAYQ